MVVDGPIGDAVLFRTDHDDRHIDQFFHDDAYVTGCKGYVECKRKYYFSEILKAAVDQTPWRMNDADFVENVRETAGAYLKGLGLREAKRRAALAEVEKRLKVPGAVALVVLDLPGLRAAANDMGSEHREVRSLLPRMKVANPCRWCRG